MNNQSINFICITFALLTFSAGAKASTDNFNSLKAKFAAASVAELSDYPFIADEAPNAGAKFKCAATGIDSRGESPLTDVVIGRYHSHDRMDDDYPVTLSPPLDFGTTTAIDDRDVGAIVSWTGYTTPLVAKSPSGDLQATMTSRKDASFSGTMTYRMKAPNLYFRTIYKSSAGNAEIYGSCSPIP